MPAKDKQPNPEAAILPDSGYKVHDGERPQPPVVRPGDPSGDAPSDATVLFDGSSLEGWETAKDGSPAVWKLVDASAMEVVGGTGDIQTKATFGNIQLHLEFASPAEVESSGQGRGNSGVFLMGLYEVQVLDNFDNPTYPDGTVGGIYGQYPPLANAIRKPGEWNSYDIIWEAPVFEGETLKTPAFITVILNNVVLHHRKKLLGPTQHKKVAHYEPHPAELPLRLQDHGNPVRFRNIWVRPIGEYDS